MAITDEDQAPPPVTLAEALVAFQANAPRIVKDSVNPHFHSKFASLDGIMDAVRVPLAECGLAVVQMPCALDSGMPALRTVLLHQSGERLEDVMPLAIDKPGPQAQGSALTYARRYSVLGVLGLVADEDDDANAAEKPRQQKEAAATGAAAGGVDPTVGLTAELLAAAETLGVKQATEEYVSNSKKSRSPAEHLAWLRDQLAAAEASVAKGTT